MGRKAVDTATDREAAKLAPHTNQRHETVVPIRRSKIKEHDVAAIFPLMGAIEFKAFAADIASNGQRDPIILLDGKVLDGRNRLHACEIAGVAPYVRDFGSEPTDGDDPRGFVISANAHRRHLNDTQKAVIASKLACLPVGRPNKDENFRVFTQQEAGELFGISDRSVQHARTVLDQGLPELVAACEAGRLAVSKAQAIARRPDQAEVLRIADLPNAEDARKAIKIALTQMIHGDGSANAPEPKQTSGRGKPEWLMRALVRHYSRIDNLVCDPFAGYCSTLRAARAENRRAIGSEMDSEIAKIAADDNLKLGRWQESLADIGVVDAVICDPPYSARTHAASTTRSDGSSAQGLTPTYTAWTPEDVHQFVAEWSPRCQGWIVALTDSELIGAYTDAYRAAGRYAFAPVPVVIKGMSVRVSGDGPSSWTVYAMVARPSTKEFVAWGTLPGAYVGTKSRELWIDEPQQSPGGTSDE